MSRSYISVLLSELCYVDGSIARSAYRSSLPRSLQTGPTKLLLVVKSTHLRWWHFVFSNGHIPMSSDILLVVGAAFVMPATNFCGLQPYVLHLVRMLRSNITKEEQVKRIGFSSNLYNS